MINLMYITKDPEVARIVERAGVDWVFVDMEYITKDIRQKGLDTVMNHHTLDDLRNIRKVVSKSKVIVRVNPIHGVQDDGYMDSETEIDAVVDIGADIVMLPYFKKCAEVETFLNYLKKSNMRHGREAKSCLLLETPQAVVQLDRILKLSGIDMVHVGLNDLYLAMGMTFMFELLADGTVEELANKVRAKGIPFGFGGIASMNRGAVPGKMILMEHYRLGSQMAIVSRSFCNTNLITDLEEIEETFTEGIKEIRNQERLIQEGTFDLEKNHKRTTSAIISLSKMLAKKK